MNDHVIDAIIFTVVIVSLLATGTRIPNFDSAILRGSNHPFAFTMEADTSNITLVAFKSQHGVWVGRFNIVELDINTTSRGKETLVRGDA
jgi:hypothetical protein